MEHRLVLSRAGPEQAPGYLGGLSGVELSEMGWSPALVGTRSPGCFLSKSPHTCGGEDVKRNRLEVKIYGSCGLKPVPFLSFLGMISPLAFKRLKVRCGSGAASASPDYRLRLSAAGASKLQQRGRWSIGFCAPKKLKSA